MRGHQENCRSRNHGSSAGGPAPRCRRRRSHQIWRPERTAKSCHRGLLTVAKGFSRLPVPKAIEGAAMTKFHFILDVKLPHGSRSEERRVGKEGVRTCSSRVSPYL